MTVHPVGRGKRTRGREYAFVQVELTCPRGHRVGKAWRHLDSELPDRWSQLTWTDTSSGGRLEGHCGRCGADCRFRWSRVAAVLDELAAGGNLSACLTC